MAKKPTKKEQKDIARRRALFSLLIQAADIEDYRDAFEVTLKLSYPPLDPLPKSAVEDLAHDFADAINFFHAVSMEIDLEAEDIESAKGEPAGYVFFDGFNMVIGSIGYQAW